MKFRKKPVVIEASIWRRNGDHPEDNSDLTAERIPPAVAAPDQVSELLCILNRDGGHRQSEVGVQQAAKEALEEVQRMKQVLAENNLLDAPVSHTYHPARHWDRTCPACLAEHRPVAPVSHGGDTPRTDALRNSNFGVVLESHEQLERELAEARAALSVAAADAGQVAMMLLQNDRDGAMQWARDIELEWKTDGSPRLKLRATAMPSATVPLEPTPEMIEEGAQRLVSWETGEEVWPDSWDGLQVAAARQEAERVWRSMYLAATGTGRTPDGYAVVMAEGYFVGIWRDRESAEKILGRSPMAKGERIEPMCFLGTNHDTKEPK